MHPACFNISEIHEDVPRMWWSLQLLWAHSHAGHAQFRPLRFNTTSWSLLLKISSGVTLWALGNHRVWCPHTISGCLARLLPIQFPANVQPGRQQVMAQVLGSLSQPCMAWWRYWLLALSWLCPTLAVAGIWRTELADKNLFLYCLCFCLHFK